MSSLTPRARAAGSSASLTGSPARLAGSSALLVGLLAGALLVQPPAASCEIVLNEILAAPAQDWDGNGAISSRDDEWIELFNAGTVPLDLGDLLLSDADSTVRIRLTGTLGAHGHLVVYGLHATQWQTANGRGVTGLSLNNAGDTARLWRIVGADTVQIDVYTYKSHESASERASGRLPDGGAWSLFDLLNPYTGSAEPTGNGCVPTPGTANQCGSTPVESATWGRVKAVYR